MITFTLDDKKYNLKPMDKDMLDKHLVWAKSKLPDPVQVAMEHIKNNTNLAPSLQEIVLRDALEHKRVPLHYHSPEVTAMMATPEGIELTMELIWEDNKLPKEELEELSKNIRDKYSSSFGEMTQEQVDVVDKFFKLMDIKRWNQVSNLSEEEKKEFYKQLGV